jgi:hypothetical protein
VQRWLLHHDEQRHGMQLQRQRDVQQSREPNGVLHGSVHAHHDLHAGGGRDHTTEQPFDDYWKEWLTYLEQHSRRRHRCRRHGDDA